jgi:hypothetical protein
LAEITGQPGITIQTMCLKKNRIIPLGLDLSEVRDFPGYFKLIGSLQQENEYNAYGIKDINRVKLKREARAVVPIFYKRDLLTVEYNLPDIFDIVLEMHEESDHISFICECAGHLKEEKIEELIRKYIKLNQWVVEQCLENTEK